MDMFKILNSCLKGPRAADDDIAKLSPWMLCKWLSGDPRTISIANTLNALSQMPIQAQYDFVRGLLHNKITFIRFPKMPKTTSDDVILKVAKRFKCNPTLAPEILSLMSDDEKREFQCEQ